MSAPKKAVAKKAHAKPKLVDPFPHITDYDAKIKQLCATGCTHQNLYNYTYGNGNSDVCSVVCTAINDCYADGKILLDDTILTFLNYICKSQQHYPNSKKQCIYKNRETLKNALSFLFGFYLPSIEIFSNLIKIPEYDMCYKSFSSNQNFTKFTVDHIDAIVTNRLEFSCDVNDTELIGIIIKNMEITVENLYKLCGCRSSALSFVLAGIIDKFSGELTPNFLDNACEGLPYTKHTVQSLVNRGFQLTENHFEIVCSKCDKESIEFILQLSRIPITREHYQALVKSTNYIKQEEEDDAHGYYWKNTTKDPWVPGYSTDKMELLIKYGYKPDYEDVIYGIEHKIEIPGIERFGIPLDKKLLELCWDNDFYPQYKFDCIEPSMIELQKLCKTKKMKDMKLLVKKHGLIPDRKCMENASCFKNNNQIYDYLFGIGGRPNYKCIENCAKELNNNYFLVKLLNGFKTINDEEIKDYQDKITYLEKQIVELGGTVKPLPAKEQNIIKKRAVKKIIEPESDKEDEVIEDQEDELTDVDTDDNISDIESDDIPVKVKGTRKGAKKIPAKFMLPVVAPVKTKAVAKKPLPKTKKVKNVEIVDDEEEIEEVKGTKIEAQVDEKPKTDANALKILNLAIDSTKMGEIQKQYRLKSSPPNKIVEVFKVDNKKKMSYSDVKKYILDKIKNDNWMDNTDKNLINVPANIKEKLNLDKDGSINFNDIDKLVCMFYN